MLLFLWMACSDAGESAGGGNGLCLDAPTVTWENFGEPLIVENCQSCHGSAAGDRHGAPDAVTFDSYEEVITWRESILRVTDPDTRTMPPGMALAERDRELLEIWLTCWE